VTPFGPMAQGCTSSYVNNECNVLGKVLNQENPSLPLLKKGKPMVFNPLNLD